MDSIPLRCDEEVFCIRAKPSLTTDQLLYSGQDPLYPGNENLILPRLATFVHGALEIPAQMGLRCI
ncbi:uncharacterized protein CTRU02_209349 [Colletotrichum truncatum]|uniref:Uncharacterized protein n=1 Tax=Colletotrichum truncatum TaxID=5467 RepID=A0ACC3YS42_COLTU|nr:uncharacterized protein CTRU02_08577 [Colletotrichum truncatum]KAF6789878.1 hypothetical protein CTRU02_08577 [Colletotrichum truncatum]